MVFNHDFVHSFVRRIRTYGVKLILLRTATGRRPANFRSETNRLSTTFTACWICKLLFCRAVVGRRDGRIPARDGPLKRCRAVAGVRWSVAPASCRSRDDGKQCGRSTVILIVSMKLIILLITVDLDEVLAVSLQRSINGIKYSVNNSPDPVDYSRVRSAAGPWKNPTRKHKKKNI